MLMWPKAILEQLSVFDEPNKAIIIIETGFFYSLSPSLSESYLNLCFTASQSKAFTFPKQIKSRLKGIK